MDLLKVLTGIPKFFEEVFPQARDKVRTSQPLERVKQAVLGKKEPQPEGAGEVRGDAVPTEEELRAQAEAAEILEESRWRGPD